MDYINEGISFDKYFLIKNLGEGAFGKVFLAYDNILKRNVALKIIEAANAHELVTNFKEAELSVKCIHNNIVQIFSADVIYFEGHLLFVIEMEYIDGQTVDNLILNNQLSIVESILILKQISYGIQFAHLNKIIHRDIKPGNILVVNGLAKITDFGLANVLGDTQINEKIYYTHTAPEVFDGSNLYSYQTDVYALGLTLYRMVNNISDWHYFLNQLKISTSNIRTGKFIELLPWDEGVPDILKRIIRKACHKDVNKRYQNVVELRNKLEQLKLGISWHCENHYRWYGLHNDRHYLMNIINKHNGLSVEIKCNNRKIMKLCRMFNTYDEACSYCKSYISKTSVL